jgi:hypothetical protein
MGFQLLSLVEDALVKNHNVGKNIANVTMQDLNALTIVNVVTAIMANQKWIIFIKAEEWKSKSMLEFLCIYSFIFLSYLLFALNLSKDLT